MPSAIESLRTNTGIPTNCDQWLPPADLDGDGVMEIDYSGTSVRTSDRQKMLELGRTPHAAGRTSGADEMLSDVLFGYQLLAGMDYALSDRLRLGIKVRYGDAFGDFSDAGHPWKPLRNHASTVGPLGTPGADLPVHYGIRADKLGV